MKLFRLGLSVGMLCCYAVSVSALLIYRPPACKTGWQTAYDHSYTALGWNDGPHYRGNADFTVLIDFALNRDGDLVGRYVKNDGVMKSEGLLEPIAEQEPCRVLFRWRQGKTKGIAELSFQSDGKFFSAKLSDPDATTTDNGQIWSASQLPLRALRR